MKRLNILLLGLISLVLFSCEGAYKELDVVLSEEFGAKVKTVNEGNHIIVVFDEMKVLKNVSQREEDYLISRVATKVIDYTGRSSFIAFSSLRVDVAPMQKSYGFPTKVTIKALEKLPVIAEVQRLLNKEDHENVLKKFDDIITPEMFEEQILKEWNDLQQWNEKDVIPHFLGFKLLQLPGEEGHFIQIGGKLKNPKGEEALVEFMFAGPSKKVMSINITYL